MHALSLGFSDAIFKIELNSNSLTSDLININGALTLGAGVAQLNASDLGSTVLAGGQVFTIAHSTDGVSGFFNGLAEGASLSFGGNQYKISYAANTNHDVTLTTVPEPGSVILLLGGLAAMLGCRRRGDV